MPVDPYSQAMVNAINASSIVPFRRFHPVAARTELLKLRAPRPEIPAHPMATVTEEMIPAPDGQIKVRILRPRLSGARTMTLICDRIRRTVSAAP